MRGGVEGATAISVAEQFEEGLERMQEESVVGELVGLAGWLLMVMQMCLNMD